MSRRIDQIAEGLAEFATVRKARVSGTFEQVVSRLPYVVAYEIAPEADGSEVVAILHVIHAARDWQPGTWPTP